MKLSPLQFEAYFLTDLNLRANQDFKVEKETKFSENDLLVEPEVSQIKDEPRRWQVSLNIKLQPAPEGNSPYSFSMSLVGVILIAPQFPQERLEEVIRTNGPTMLYGVAREMARALTARGPFPSLILPSVSFIPDPIAQPPAKVSETAEKTAQAPKAEGK